MKKGNFIKLFIIQTGIVMLCFNIVRAFSNGNMLNPDIFALDTVRVFHPAFPLELLNPLTIDEYEKIMNIRSILGLKNDKLSIIPSQLNLPWKILPEIGLSEPKLTPMPITISEGYERVKHHGYIVWAHKLNRPEKGCILINHWANKLIHLEKYNPVEGATGKTLCPLTTEMETITWPPYLLETEIMEKKWQPVSVSENILTGEVFNYLPLKMPLARWELLLLLLLSPTKNAEELQTLLDTGLSPKRGLISYLRLLMQIVKRTENLNSIPSYRKITEVKMEL